MFGVGMSATFFLTTGEFWHFLRRAKRPSSSEEEEEIGGEVGAGAAEGETTQLISGGGGGGMKKPHPIPTPASTAAAHGAHGAFAFGSPSKRLSSSLFDEEPLLRRLSLIVPQAEADAASCELLEQHAAGAGGGGGGHLHPNHPHAHRGRGGSGGDASGSGGGGGGAAGAGGGGAAYATII